MKRIINIIVFSTLMLSIICGTFYYCLTHPMLSRKQIKIINEFEKHP